MLFFRELLYIIGAIASIAALAHLYLEEDDKCLLLVGTCGILIAYIGYVTLKWVLRRKNAEINEMAKRKKALEIIVLGSDRISSGYDPDVN